MLAVHQRLSVLDLNESILCHWRKAAAAGLVTGKGWGPAVEDRMWKRDYHRQQYLNLLQKSFGIAELRHIF